VRRVRPTGLLLSAMNRSDRRRITPATECKSFVLQEPYVYRSNSVNKFTAKTGPIFASAAGRFFGSEEKR